MQDYTINQNSYKSNHLLMWTAGAIYFCILYALLYINKIPQDIRILDALISALCIIGCGYLESISLKYYFPSHYRTWKLITISLLVTTISILSTKYLLQQFTNESTLQYFEDSIPYRFLINFLLFLCSVILIVFRNMQNEAEENIKRKEATEKMLREAELYNLRQQLQPHFLFNSLNSIIALINFDPSAAKNMAFQLSEFLRGTLRKDDNQLIPLKEELEHLQLYLDIESVRFGDRLTTHINSISDPLESGLLPSMILQPIVENAIKFGLYNVTEKVDIRIDISLESNLLTINVSNPYDQEQYDANKGTGFGLRSIQRRLFLLYSRTDLLSYNTGNGYYNCTIKIPQQND